uniref:Large ribosomal subunit protein bL19c n=3 Tax=Saccharina TaxID=309357 RepID=A0A8K1W1Y5_9PHAE|nr:50S ribosomal protein L19 [Saccharina japonica]YP_010863354.1 50S ribosomal protein L19 [Saccharina japonica x Saccharina latissima]QOV02234.1 50S ribosomal protein L19 [Saccharina sp. ye-B]UFQ24772.1 50S ribosomal protein L19 [Saccharina sp. Rongfu]WAX38118.1 ribosomal protein L19 [Saccharina japonica cultivar 901]AFC40097.1 50S ribosomal protein L19 [Saccharina japonica]UFQ24911.1 50S ribosomal protein L19 [Saccharina sp. Rongfu]
MKNIKQATFLNDKELIDSVESVHIKKNLSKIFVGDTVKIGVFIKEGNKERIQYYQGIILGKNNSGINLTISVRKVFQGIGVERNFLIHSPKFESIEVIKSSRVRRAKLYYLRSIVGKGSRLKQRFRTK